MFFRSLFRHPLTSRPRNESVFYGPAPTAPENYRERNGGVYPSLGIPISFGNRKLKMFMRLKWISYFTNQLVNMGKYGNICYVNMATFTELFSKYVL